MTTDLEFETVETRYGRVAFFLNDTIIGRSLQLYGEWAQREISFLQNLIRPGATVVDVGGYIGTHALAFSRFVGPEGRVVVLEPQRESFQLLQRNVRENSCANVLLKNAAAGDRLGEIEVIHTDFSTPQNFGGFELASSAESSRGEEKAQGGRRVERIPQITIDSLELKQCALLKIDVEGAEHLVIRGARETIKRCLPFIYAECNSLEKGLETLATLGELNYCVMIHIVDAFNQENFRGANENMFGAGREIAIFGIPKADAKPDEWQRASGQILLPVRTADDLAFCMLQKPQYIDEVLQVTTAARTLADRYFQTAEPARTIAAAAERIAYANKVIGRLSRRIADLNRRSPGARKIKNVLLKFGAARKGVSAQELDAVLYSAFFDADYYLAADPNLRVSAEHPALHYLRTGGVQGRDPGPSFSSSEYLSLNRDVQESGANALAHYELFGRDEGRNLIGLRLEGSSLDSARGAAPPEWRQAGRVGDRSPAREHSPTPLVQPAPADSPAPHGQAEARKILIVVPLYANPGLVPALVQSIRDCAPDFSSLDVKLLFINDSPEDGELRAALESQLPCLAGTNVALWTNGRNLGFVRTCNKGLELALVERRDAILLNSDCLLTRGAISEMAEVAYEDPLIGFVSPRSNNATICNSPYPDRYRELEFDAAVAAHRFIERLLPRMTYVPTAVGFCLYIRHLMLAEFGLLDSVYDRGYNEENDFIMRCNRRGYRTVLANRAFVYHLGKASFSLVDGRPDSREKENRKILLQRYPEYDRAVARYFSGVEFKAQSLLAGFIPDQYGRQRVLFECSNLGNRHDGTSEFATKMIQSFCEIHAGRYVCAVSCSPEVFRRHGMHRIPGLELAGQGQQLTEAAPFAAAVRLAQPFSQRDLTFLARLAPLSGFVMLDTIAMDCLGLDEQDLGFIWSQMPKVVGLIGYNSNFSRDQFRRRFDVPAGVVEFMALHSVVPDEYLPNSATRPIVSTPDSGHSTPPRESGYVLIVGNHFTHKNVLETLALFREVAKPPPIVVLGQQVEDKLVVSSYASGELSAELVESLYANSALVVYPSHYEGFGFPIMHAIKYRKPVAVRNLPSAREIKDKTVDADNIHLFETTAEMVAFACSAPNWIASDPYFGSSSHDWRRCAAALGEGVAKATDQFEFSALRGRLMEVELMEREERLNEQVILRQQPMVRRYAIGALRRLRRYTSAATRLMP